VDGSNYPYTKPGWNERPIPNDKKGYLGRKKNPKGEKVLEVTFCRYDEGHPEIKNDMPTKLVVDLKNYEVSYHSQPIMRLIDYILC